MNKYKKKMEGLKAHIIVAEVRPPSLEEIRQTENEIGYCLPDDYLNFLLHYGGINLYMVTASFHRQNAEYDEIGPELFYGFLPDHTYDLLNTYQTYKGRMPSNLIPIGCDAGGGEICLSLDRDDKGTVYYWDRYLEEDPEEGEEVGYSKLFPIARTFDDFINSLTLNEEEE